MKSLVFSSLARADLSAIWHYSRQTWSADQADRYVSSLMDACDDLAAGTKHGQSIADVKQDYFRVFVISHAIYYTYENASDLLIVRILHQSMDVNTQL